MRLRPSSTVTSRPSISSFGMFFLYSSRRMAMLCAVFLERAPTLSDVSEKLVAELTDIALRRHGCGIGKDADGVAHHVVGNLIHQIDVFRPTGPFFQPQQELVQPTGALAARRALPTGFVMIETINDLQRPHHAGVLVHNDNASRTEEGIDLAHGVEV